MIKSSLLEIEAADGI